VIDQDGQCLALQTQARNAYFEDDLEPFPLSGWTHTAAINTDDWIATFSGNAHSGNVAWFTADVGEPKDAWLVTPPYLVRPASKLIFWHTYEFENAGVSNGYDGGVIEISGDGGQSWTDLGPQIREGGYNSTIAVGWGNPLAGRKAWSSGKLGPMSRVVTDLTPYAGQTILVRFRIGCDQDTEGSGWYLDDISFVAAEDCIGSLAQLRFDAAAFACGASSIRFTLSDAGLSQASGASPGMFRLGAAEGGDMVEIAPVGLTRIDPAGVWEGACRSSPARPPDRLLSPISFSASRASHCF